VTSLDAWTEDGFLATAAASTAPAARPCSPLSLQDVSRALCNDELEMWFQPKVKITTGEVVGAEALLRWRHPHHGVLGPVDLLDTARRAGLMPRITRHALDQALAASARWRADGLRVDLSPWSQPQRRPARSGCQHTARGSVLPPGARLPATDHRARR